MGPLISIVYNLGQQNKEIYTVLTKEWSDVMLLLLVDEVSCCFRTNPSLFFSSQLLGCGSYFPAIYGTAPDIYGMAVVFSSCLSPSVGFSRH